MAINWLPKRVALDTAIATASPLDAKIGARVRLHLQMVGKLYDTRFPSTPPPGRPSVRIRSAAHMAWENEAKALISDMDEIAAAADGAPLAPLTGPVDDLMEDVRRRLEAALATAAPEHMLQLEGALTARLPGEPRFYVDAFYEGGASYQVRKLSSGIRYAPPVREDASVYRYTLDGVIVHQGAPAGADGGGALGYNNDGELEAGLVAALAMADAFLAVV